MKIFVGIRHLDGKRRVVDASANFDTLKSCIEMHRNFIHDDATYSIAEFDIENAIIHEIADRKLRLVK